MTKTLAQLGLVVYLLARRWNGNHPPAMVWMNDVMFGLTMTSPLRHLYLVVYYFPLQNSFLIVCFCETSLVSVRIKL
jgi:hypothetical protein